MKPGSEEWFREEAEKIVHPYGPDTCVVIESALRRVWNERGKVVAEGLMKSADTYRKADKQLFPLAVVRAEECEAQANNIRALKVKT